MKAIISILLSFVISTCLSQHTPRSWDVSQWGQVKGTAPAKELFNNLVNSCSAKSSVFNDFIITDFYFNETPIELLEIKAMKEIGGVVGGGFAYNQADVAKIHLNHILEFPSLNKKGEKYIYPPKIPEWATSRCMVLIHELSEAWYSNTKLTNWTITKSERFDKSHRHGIAMENLIRREYEISQCRNKEWEIFESKAKHMKHNDAFIQIGDHTEVIHQFFSDIDIQLTVTYEHGQDEDCHHSNYEKK